MLHKSIVKLISRPEIRILYETRLRLQSTDIRVSVKETIRKLRQQFRSTAKDRLQLKADKYGNNGGWLEAKQDELAKIRQANNLRALRCR